MSKQSGDITVHVGYADMRCVLHAEGVSWSPDVADDMVRRMATLWKESLETAVINGLISIDPDDDDEFDDEEVVIEETVEFPVINVMDQLMSMLKEDGEDNG